MTNETSKALIARLEAGMEVVAVGGFSLDLQGAQAKLAAYRLADPQAFVLLFVELAHVLEGCAAVEFILRSRSTQVILHGVELDESELRGLLEAGDVDSREVVSAARRQAHQLLSLALVTLGQLDHVGAVLGSSAAPSQLELARGGDMRLVPRDRVVRERSTWLLISDRSWIWKPGSSPPDVAAQRSELLRTRGRYASVPLWVDGQLVSEGFTLKEVTDAHVVRDVEGALLGVLGWSRARPQATLLLVANGVLWEKLSDSELPPRLVGLVQASDLPRDLSMTKLLRQDAYARRIAQIREAVSSLPPQPWTPALYVGTLSAGGLTLYMLAASGLCFCLLSVVGWLAALDFGAWLVVFFVMPLIMCFGIAQLMPLRTATRHDQLRAKGRRAVATVESCQALGGGRDRRVEVACLVHVPGQAPYPADFVDMVRRDEHGLHPGAVVHVRVDPSDPARVCLAVDPASSTPRPLAP